MRPKILINKDTLVNSENRIIIFIIYSHKMNMFNKMEQSHFGHYFENFATGRYTTVICKYYFKK